MFKYIRTVVQKIQSKRGGTSHSAGYIHPNSIGILPCRKLEDLISASSNHLIMNFIENVLNIVKGTILIIYNYILMI